jgi:general secretion pathway protein D
VTPPGARAPGAAQPTPARPTAAEQATERAPLIIAERRSNSLIVYGRKPEMETIRRLVSQLDVNIYGGRRVFIYYAEHAKSKDLAATLNAIYTGRETVPTTTSTPSPTSGRPATSPALPPPPPSTAAPGARVGAGADTGLIEGEVRFIADETTNAVIVTTYPRNWPEIDGTIRQLDRQPRQVLIEVLVAEITLSDDLRLGVDWALRFPSSDGQRILTSSSIAPGIITAPNPDLPITLPTGGLTAFAFHTDRFFGLLNTFAADNRVNVLSTPHVMTSENKKAVINVSTSIPIVTSQQVPFGGTTGDGTNTTVVGTQTVEYRDAGVILTVTPRIGERGTVALDIKQEVNDVGAPVPPSDQPSIIKREAETSVVLLNNQTLVLGGLIQERKENIDRGIPYLKNIPLIGYIFGAKQENIRRTELVLLITPRVIGTALDAARITDEMRRTTPALSDAIDRAPRQPSPYGAPTTPPPPPPPPPPPAPSE